MSNNKARQSRKPHSQTRVKKCPLLIVAGYDQGRKCLGPKCALWVALEKPMVFGNGEVSYPHPDYKLSYHGCGLVVNIPWKPVKREVKKEVPQA